MPASVAPAPASKAAPGAAGLTNDGNTCYFNAAVQCLLHTRPLVDLFVRGNWQALLAQGPGGRVAEEFAALAARAWAGESAVLRPSRLKEAAAAVAPRFAGSAQQDAQELLGTMIDALHDGVGAGIAEAFYGQLRSHVECPACGETEDLAEPFTTLPVPIRRDLGACFDAFAEQETLGKGNEWRCTGCGKAVRARKKMAIFAVAKCFIVHLKRFTAERKIADRIDYPETIDLARWVVGPQGRQPLRYRLYAVSEHHGGLNSGHYTAHTRVGEKWYLFDDTAVREVDASAARNDSAYVLHYERIEAA
jgi:ubiquitin C-terminal hydrolase